MKDPIYLEPWPDDLEGMLVVQPEDVVRLIPQPSACLLVFSDGTQAMTSTPTAEVAALLGVLWEGHKYGRANP